MADEYILIISPFPKSGHTHSNSLIMIININKIRDCSWFTYKHSLNSEGKKKGFNF
jgi:hypothetical protein